MFNVFWKFDLAAVKSMNYTDSHDAFNNLCFKSGCWLYSIKFDANEFDKKIILRIGLKFSKVPLILGI